MDNFIKTPSAKWYIIPAILIVFGIASLAMAISHLVDANDYQSYFKIKDETRIDRPMDFAICYEDVPSSIERATGMKLTFTFTNVDTGEVYQSVSMESQLYSPGRNAMLGTVKIAQGGVYHVTMQGIIGNMLLSNSPIIIKTLVARSNPLYRTEYTIWVVISSIILALGYVAAIIITALRTVSLRKHKERTSPSAQTPDVVVVDGVQYERQGKPRKKLWVALALAAFPLTGMFGIDRFYLGHIWMGLLKFFTVGCYFVLWIVDLIRIATGNMKDKNGNDLI